MMEVEEHRVHFTEGQEEEQHDNNIKVLPSGNGRAIVHCGLLKINHKYNLKFDVPRSLLPDSNDVRVAEDEPPNSNCRLLKIDDSANDKTQASVTVEVIAHKDKLQKETVTLVDANDAAKKVSLIIQARVLGKGKGTPMLKEGVQMVEVLPTQDDSDIASDWKGF